MREILGAHPVEFMGPWAMNDFAGPRGGIEAHLRQAVAPSQNWQEAKILVKSLGLRPGPVHQHVVARLNTARFRKDPVLDITRLLEFTRRVNLYAEMLKILDDKPLQTILERGGLQADTLKASFLPQFFEAISAFLAKHTLVENKVRELSAVALRLPGTYDQEDLWGLEFRTLNPNDPPKTQAKLAKLMDLSQIAMDENSYGIPKATMKT